MSALGRRQAVELADLLQQAYAADHGEPGEQLTDRVVRYDLAQLIDSDEAMKAAVIEAWLLIPA